MKKLEKQVFKTSKKMMIGRVEPYFPYFMPRYSSKERFLVLLGTSCRQNMIFWRFQKHNFLESYRIFTLRKIEDFDKSGMAWFHIYWIFEK